MLKIDTQLRGDKDNPYHLSIGQVIENKSNKIALIKKKNGIITLPRETAYLEENYIDTLRRGAESEVGVTISIIRYLGSLITFFNRDRNSKVEKTTIYFYTKVIDKTEKSLAKYELDDIVIWKDYDETIHLLNSQNNKEAEIVKRVLNI